LTVTDLLGPGPHSDPPRAGTPDDLPLDRNPAELVAEFATSPSTRLAFALKEGRIEPNDIAIAIVQGDLDLMTAAWAFEKAQVMGFVPQFDA